MKFEFYVDASRIYDFLMFPRFLYLPEEYEKSRGTNTYIEVMGGDYLEFAQGVSDQLGLFSEEIGEFYMQEFSSNHDFIGLLLPGVGVVNFTDEVQILRAFEQMETDKLRLILLTSIIAIDHEDDLSRPEAEVLAREIYLAEDQVKALLRDLPIDPGTKWNLSLILENPKESVQRYVRLMEKLLPIFGEIYRPFQEEVQAYGNYLLEIVNTQGYQGLEDLTYSNLELKVVESEAMSNLLVSVIGSFQLTIATTSKNLIWGLRLEEGFRRIKELNENKTMERVTLFKNLGDKTRYEVLKFVAAGETSTKKMADALGVTSATVSYHLSNLAVAKIIKLAKVEGRLVYRVDYDFVKEALVDFEQDILA